MAVLRVKNIRNALLKKGFREKEGDHHYYRFFVGDQKTRIMTKISHGEKEIGASLVQRMSSQLHISKKEFLNLVDCSLSEDGYREILMKTGHIKP